MPMLIHRAKLLQLFSLHPNDQQVYACCHNFMTVTQSYHSKNIPAGRLHDVKIGKSVLLYVFTIAFPTSLLCAEQFLYSLQYIGFIPGYSSVPVQYGTASSTLGLICLLYVSISPCLSDVRFANLL